MALLVNGTSNQALVAGALLTLCLFISLSEQCNVGFANLGLGNVGVGNVGFGNRGVLNSGAKNLGVFNRASIGSAGVGNVGKFRWLGVANVIGLPNPLPRG